jgi:DNA-binding response OmpR family regulator
MPIVMLTAAHDPVQEPEVLRAGADAYMAKPFEAETLMTTIKHVLTIAPDRRGEYRRSAAASLERNVAFISSPNLSIVPNNDPGRPSPRMR